MKRMNWVFLVLGWILFSLPVALAEDISGDFDREEFGAGFVAIEGGPWLLMGGAKSVVNTPVMFYLTTGFSVSHAMDQGVDQAEGLKIGPKVGVGFGSAKGADTDLFYDLMLKVRYTFGSLGSAIRPYLDVGPGFVNFFENAGEVEAGGGFDFYFPDGSVGINANYKELFGAGAMKRGVTILGSVAYRF